MSKFDDFISGVTSGLTPLVTDFAANLRQDAVDDMLAFPQKTQAFSQHLKTLSGFQQLLLPIDGEDGVLLLVKE